MSQPVTAAGRPRVGIDVTAAINQSAGIGRAARETVTALAAAEPPLPLRLFYCREATATAAANEGWLAQLTARHRHVRARRLPLPPRLVTRLWLRLRLPAPAELLTGPVEVLLAPDFVAPPVARARTVVTVHDVSFLTAPQYADPGLRAYLTSAMPAALRRAAHVVAVSEATRQDVIGRLGVPAERISVAYNGVEPRFRPLPPAAVAAVRDRHQLPARFILTVGTLEPRKNHVTLIRAFAALAPALPELRLVVAGRRGWLDEPIFAAVRRLDLDERVRFLGAFPDADLPALYNAATAFAYPSWYEGFGLPPLEAMACGTPVVTSNVSSLPEVVGEAGLTVAPDDEAGLARALGRLVADEPLRQTFSELGRRRAARFTWSATAAALIEVFDRVA